MSRKMDQLRQRGFKSEGFREGYEARDALIRLGEMLRQLREASGLKQAQLAARVGMTQPAISRIESGFGPHGPEIDTVMRYMHGCDFELVIGAKHREEKIAAIRATAKVVAPAAALDFETVL